MYVAKTMTNATRAFLISARGEIDIEQVLFADAKKERHKVRL